MALAPQGRRIAPGCGAHGLLCLLLLGMMAAVGSAQPTAAAASTTTPSSLKAPSSAIFGKPKAPLCKPGQARCGEKVPIFPELIRIPAVMASMRKLGVDVCAQYNGGCSADATCALTYASRSCACKLGFSGNGITCTPSTDTAPAARAVNPCDINNGGCSANATCTNTAGNRTCTCKPGFLGNGDTCAPVVHCSSIPNGGCGDDATCTDAPGGHTCACKPGFSGDPNTQCVPDCNVNNGGCDGNATCTSLAGGTRACACKLGFKGNGYTCAAENHCNSIPNGGCSSNAACTDIPGGHTCACKPGYSGDGITCTRTCARAFTLRNGVCEIKLRGAPHIAIQQFTTDYRRVCDFQNPSQFGETQFSRAFHFVYMPDRDVVVSISTAGSDFNTLVGVYSGDEPEWWDIPLACNDDRTPRSDVTSFIPRFEFKAGQIYFIAVDARRIPRLETWGTQFQLVLTEL